MEAIAEEDNIDQAHVAIIKRQAPNTLSDCVIYRYGSFSTDIEIIGEILSLTCIFIWCIIDLQWRIMYVCILRGHWECSDRPGGRSWWFSANRDGAECCWFHCFLPGKVRSGKAWSWNLKIQPDGEFMTLPALFSLPTEVCTVVSDADCHMPVMTICNAVSPSSECQLILRHFFNDSGIFCINVSMMNDVSMAVTNARVNINIGGFIHCWNFRHGAPKC